MGLERVKMNYSEVGRMLKSDGVRNMLTEKMGPVLAAAQADPHDDTFEYEGSLHIEQHTTSRAVVRVVADAPHALVVEANFGVLARAMDAAG